MKTFVAEPRRHRREAGFTIAEVVAAVMVMAFGITASIVVLQNGFRSLDVARGVTLASQVAQSEIERLRLLPWASSTGGDAISTLPESDTINLSEVFISDPTLAKRFEAVRAVAGVTGRETEMKAITITVTWKSSDGRSHSRKFQTYYCKDGLYDYYYTVARS